MREVAAARMVRDRLSEDATFDLSCAVKSWRKKSSRLRERHMQRPHSRNKPGGSEERADQPVWVEWRETLRFGEMSGTYRVVCILEVRFSFITMH